MKSHSFALRAVSLGVLFVACNGFTHGQSQAAPASPVKLEFEAASIRLLPPFTPKLVDRTQARYAPRFGAHVDASLAEYRDMALQALIANAYSLKPYQVDGPAWLTRERFDIEARMPHGGSKSEAPQMLQALLAERFGLVVHRDSKKLRVIALVVAKKGPKLQPALAAPAPIDENAPLQPGESQIEGPDGPVRVRVNADGSKTLNMGAKGTATQLLDVQNKTIDIQSSNLTMAGFAEILTSTIRMGGAKGPQVVDMTGLKGSYPVSVDIPLAALIHMALEEGFGPPQAPPGSVPSASSSIVIIPYTGGGAETVYASVKKLGLKLEDRKVTEERLVVDKVNKEPTPN